VVIKPHPGIITTQEAQTMPRYFPKRVKEKPAMTDIPAEPAEKGIILKSTQLAAANIQSNTSPWISPNTCTGCRRSKDLVIKRKVINAW
jgi:hypothetical protein